MTRIVYNALVIIQQRLSVLCLVVVFVTRWPNALLAIFEVQRFSQTLGFTYRFHVPIAISGVTWMHFQHGMYYH